MAENERANPIFTMMVGLPGSGKSTYINKFFKERSIHSSDAIREELSGDANNQDINSKVFRVLHKRIKEDLIAGKNVVYDATNISWKRRKAFLQELSKIPCTKECIVMATPFEVCLEQNKERDRVVPYDVIERMYKNFDIPFYNEGWNHIYLAYNHYNYPKAYGHWGQFIYDTLDYCQCNPHHNLSLGHHCLNCSRYIEENWNNSLSEIKGELMIAGAIHDNGKPFTQVFTNSKGEPTEYAHYYRHELVGSYNSLFYEMEEGVDKLIVAALIRWHMLLHFKKDWNEKTYLKYKKEFSDNEYLTSIDFWDALNLLHKADVEAH